MKNVAIYLSLATILITNISSKAGVLELQGRFTYEKIKLDRNQIFDKKMHFAVIPNLEN